MNKKVISSSLVGLALVLTLGLLAPGSPQETFHAAGKKTADADAAAKDRQYEVEVQQLELEKLKYQLEVQKAQDEKSKTIWTAASIVLSFAIGAGTLLFGIITQNSQARLQFEMKAAEIVMDAKGPRGALTKAQTLASLFPGRLPPNFAESVDKEHFKGSSAESKRELIKLLAEKSTPAEVVGYWQQLFPGDEWARQLKVASSEIDPNLE